MMTAKTFKTSVWAGAATLVVGASLLSLLPGATPVNAGIGATLGQRCYPAKRAKGVDVPPQVLLVQDSLQGTNSTIGKPYLICLPAEVSNGTPLNVTAIFATTEVCYKIKDPKGTPKTPAKGAPAVNVSIPFIGSDSLDVKPSTILCLPADLPPV